MKSEKKNPSLSSLMERFAQNDVIAELEKEYQSAGGLKISLSLIDDNKLVRKIRPKKDSCERMASGIVARGLWNPLLVRPSGDRYELILGRKRYYGSRLAKLEEVPCIVQDKDDEEMALMLLADLRDQRDTNVVEMALVFDFLIKNFSYSQANLADIAHVSRPQVTNILRLLRLPEPVFDMVAKGNISYGHAKALIPLPYEDCLELADEILEKNLSVREVELEVREKLHPGTIDEALDRAIKASGALYIEEGENHLVFDFASEAKKKAFLKKLGKEDR